MCAEEALMVKQKKVLGAAFAKLINELEEKSIQKQATHRLPFALVLFSLLIFTFISSLYPLAHSVLPALLSCTHLTFLPVLA